MKPSKGNALVLGYDVVRDYRMIRRSIAYLPQEAILDRNLTPYEAVKWFLVARGLSIREASSRTVRWLKETDLWGYKDRVGWRLSGGLRRRVLTTMVLATESDIIFLDEPTVGLDIESKYAIWRILREFVGSGHTVILTTHDMREAEALADRVIIMSKGVVVAEGNPINLISKLPYRYKVIIRGDLDIDASTKYNNIINLGDRKIAYAPDYNTAKSIIECARDISNITIERVSLEDVYLYHVSC